MSNYTKTTNFGAKDTLPSGDSQKIIRGTEFDTEFNNVATAIATKLEVDGSNNLAISGTFSSTKLIPTGGTATGNGMYLPAANAVAISTNGTERLRIDSSGVASFASNPILNGGTANGLVYLNGSKVATSGSAVTFDGTNLATTGTASATKLIPTGGTATGNGLYLPAANTLALSTNGTERVRVDSSGNLGLGVTPSAWNSGGNFQLASGKNISAGNGIGLYANGYFDGAWKYINSVGAAGYVQSANEHIWYTAPSGTAGNTITFYSALTLSGSDTSSLLTMGRGFLTQGTGYAGAGSSTADPYLFYTNNTERARITSGGDLLVGTTAKRIDERVVFVFNGTTASGLNLDDSATTGTSNAQRFYRNAVQVGTITTTTTATAYNTSSDYRLKDNQQPLTGSGAFIDALQPKTWDWATNGSKGVGFIAHEVQTVSPNSVVGEKDAVDVDGNPIMQAMEYGSAEFIANIVAELQSLRARVATLENN